MRVGLLACAPFVLAVPWMQTRAGTAVVIVGALILIGVLWAPLMVMLSNASTAWVEFGVVTQSESAFAQVLAAVSERYRVCMEVIARRKG